MPIWKVDDIAERLFYNFGGVPYILLKDVYK